MPSGDTHYRYFMRGYGLSIPISLLCVFLDYRISGGYIIGYSLGRWVSPDWDLMSVTSDEGRMVNEIPILGHFMFGVSSAYGSIFRRQHRSFLSHFPYISTIIRLVFLFIVPFTFLDSWGINMIGGGWWVLWLGLWAGLSHADGIHWWLDKFYGGDN